MSDWADELAKTVPVLARYEAELAAKFRSAEQRGIWRAALVAEAYSRNVGRNIAEAIRRELLSSDGGTGR